MNEEYEKNYKELLEAYINYNCFANPFYCEFQRKIDQDRVKGLVGNLIVGGNWYDERYEMFMGVNRGGLYAKTFQTEDNSHATVGFRCVLRLKN